MSNNNDNVSVAGSENSIATTENQDVPNLEGLDDFKEKIKQWLNIDNQIRDLKTKIKILNANQTELTPAIMNYMGKNEIHNMNLGDSGKLKFVQRETCKGITQKFLKEKLVEFLEDENKGIEAFQHILDGREKKQNQALKRLI